jgi:hypothetical protein
MDTQTILALHRNPGHAVPWYLKLRDDVEGHPHEVITVAIRHGERGRYRPASEVPIPGWLREAFDFTGYESLDELQEMFESRLPRARDGAIIMKITEPMYR